MSRSLLSHGMPNPELKQLGCRGWVRFCEENHIKLNEVPHSILITAHFTDLKSNPIN